MSLVARRDPSKVGATLKPNFTPCEGWNTNPYLELCPGNVVITCVDELVILTEAAHNPCRGPFNGLLTTEDKLRGGLLHTKTSSG